MGISTRVISISFNTDINIELFYHYIPVVTKEKKTYNLGDIDSVQFENLGRGLCYTPSYKYYSETDTYKQTYFKNQMSFNMYVENKIINVKIFKNKKNNYNKLNITSVQDITQATDAARYILGYIKYLSQKGVYVCKTPIYVNHIRSVSVRTSFKLGFKIKREKLHEQFFERDGFWSYFDALNDIKVKIKYSSNKYFTKDSDGNIVPRDYTFIVFSTGSVNFFGIDYCNEMETVYNKFITNIKKVKHKIIY